MALKTNTSHKITNQAMPMFELTLVRNLHDCQHKKFIQKLKTQSERKIFLEVMMKWKIEIPDFGHTI